MACSDPAHHANMDDDRPIEIESTDRKPRKRHDPVVHGMSSPGSVLSDSSIPTTDSECGETPDWPPKEKKRKILRAAWTFPIHSLSFLLLNQWVMYKIHKKYAVWSFMFQFTNG